MMLMEKAGKDENPYDIALINYVMLGIDDLTRTNSIGITGYHSNTSLIMLTSASEMEFARRFDKSCFSAYLTKPVCRSDLLNTIALILEAKQADEKIEFITHETLIAKRYSSTKIQTGLSFTNTKLLLVEDNRINRALAEEMLYEIGCTIVIAENGEIALGMVKEHDFDLIFMDCQMPVMDGFEASKKLCLMKKEKFLADIPIIALTANAMKDDKEKCLDAGMNDYITKPVRKDNLRHVLAKWLPQEKHVLSIDSDDKICPENAKKTVVHLTHSKRKFP